MRKHHLLAHVLPGLGLLALANLVPQTFVGAAEAQAPELAPGPARVWFLRPIPYIWRLEHIWRLERKPISKSNGWQAGRRVTRRPVIASRRIPSVF
jgi:hypothetical protein